MAAPKLEWAKEWLREKRTKALYINGEWKQGHGIEMESINPATGEVIGTYVCADEKDIEEAAKAAREAFDHGPWRTEITNRERGVIMRKLADLIREHLEELATIETMDNGKLFT